ncbi:hypothetical protein SBD_6594 [Streptomyces bottropensis ATCC 25435]|uniref:Uncharacterized protein n=1 Tax=Streptomyces bottropensis ATCC 25435 TaxID=1054862 RepID=M3D780_9ACTN|nr:hypothetical protein SBD_6594 [Streptomyces bottropensis ATCC 25435]
MTHQSTKAGTPHHRDTGAAARKHPKGVIVRALDARPAHAGARVLR